jgi:hypothetical protein
MVHGSLETDRPSAVRPLVTYDVEGGGTVKKGPPGYPIGEWL